MKLKNKKAELTTQQIVIIVVLITSFAIILFFIFRLDLGKVTNKEICHNSVVMKSKSSLGGNLDCKTTYVCISGGEDCEGYYDIKEEVDLRDVNEARNKIMEIIANEMADCWWMFGEGKVDYIGLNVKVATIGEVNCAICSRIKFDEKIKEFENKNPIDYNKFYVYLNSKKVEGIDYLTYLYNTNNIGDIEKLIDYDRFENFDFSDQYIILTGIGKLGTLSRSWNFFAGGVDLFNKVFPTFFGIPKAPQFEDYGVIPVTIKKKEDIDKLKCDEFLTKA